VTCIVTPAVKDAIRAAVFSAVLVFAARTITGPLGRESPESYLPAWVVVPCALVQFPGVVVPVLLSMFFGPGNVHDPGFYIWMMTPLNLFFYFAIFFRGFRSAEPKPNSHQGSP